MSLQEYAWVLILLVALSHLFLFIKEDVAPGRGRSEVIPVASVEQKGEIAQIAAHCGGWMLHTLQWESN